MGSIGCLQLMAGTTGKSLKLAGTAPQLLSKPGAWATKELLEHQSLDKVL